MRNPFYLRRNSYRNLTSAASFFTLLLLCTATLAAAPAKLDVELLTAIIDGDASRAKQTLQQGASPNAIIRLPELRRQDRRQISEKLDALQLDYSPYQYAHPSMLDWLAHVANSHNKAINSALLQSLIAAGANTAFHNRNAAVFAESSDGDTRFHPLHTAVKNRQIEMVEWLLKTARIDPSSNTAHIALLIAIDNNDAALLSMLLRHGVNPNHSSVFRKTPLLYAARAGWQQGCQVLLQAGAHIYDPALGSASAASIAFLHGHQNLGSWLIAQGSPVLVDDEEDIAWQIPYGHVAVANAALADGYSAGYLAPLLAQAYKAAPEAIFEWFQQQRHDIDLPADELANSYGQMFNNALCTGNPAHLATLISWGANLAVDPWGLANAFACQEHEAEVIAAVKAADEALRNQHLSHAMASILITDGEIDSSVPKATVAHFGSQVPFDAFQCYVSSLLYYGAEDFPLLNSQQPAIEIWPSSCDADIKAQGIHKLAALWVSNQALANKLIDILSPQDFIAKPDGLYHRDGGVLEKLSKQHRLNPAQQQNLRHILQTDSHYSLSLYMQRYRGDYQALVDWLLLHSDPDSPQKHRRYKAINEVLEHALQEPPHHWQGLVEDGGLAAFPEETLVHHILEHPTASGIQALKPLKLDLNDQRAIDIYSTHSGPVSPMLAAIKKNHPGSVDALFQLGYRLKDFEDDDAAQDYLADTQAMNALKELLTNGLPTDFELAQYKHGKIIRSKKRKPLLEIAMQHGRGKKRYAFIKALLEHGLSLSKNYRFEAGNKQTRGAPLAWAAASNDLKLVELFLEHGADPNDLGSGMLRRLCFNTPPLLAAVLDYSKTEIIQTLVDAGADTQYRDLCGNSIDSAATNPNVRKILGLATPQKNQ